MTAIYALVKRYLREGKAPSRNQAFDTYNDPEVAKALRIYRHLYTLVEDLHALRKQKDVSLFHVTRAQAGADRFCIHYERNQVIRTSFLTQEEWDLIREDAQIADFLHQSLQLAAPTSDGQKDTII
jgi:hypothetical protein